MKQKAMQVFVFSSSASSSSFPPPPPPPCHHPTLPLREQTAANLRQSPPADREDWMQIRKCSVDRHLEEFAGHCVLHPIASNLQHRVWPRHICSPCQEAAAQPGAGALGPRRHLPAGLPRRAGGESKQPRGGRRAPLLGQLDAPGGVSWREEGGGGGL